MFAHRPRNEPPTPRLRLSPRVVLRYLLLQVPGWLLGAVAIAVACDFIGCEARTFWLILAVWVAKDAVLFPFVWPGYVTGAVQAPRALIGARAITVERLAPAGYVQVGSELWKAEARDADRPLPSGAPVRVVAARGLTLVVAALPPSPR